MITQGRSRVKKENRRIGGIVSCASRLAPAIAAFALAYTTSADAPAKRAFETVPRQALVELKATVGKPFSSGLVFIDGKFIEPPYKVERYGTAMRINGRQVTNQLIPWDEFLKTQEGVRIERTEIAAPAAASAVDVTPAAPVASYDESDDFDDLFDDNPKPKKSKPAVAPRRVVQQAPQVQTKVIFDGVYSANAKTTAMLNRLNKMRTNLEISLRKGGACFFGTKYSSVRSDSGPANMFLQSVPMLMKTSTSFEAFSSGVRAKGIVFLSDAVLRDIYNNKIDYIKLLDRAKKVKEERKWASMLNGAGL